MRISSDNAEIEADSAVTGEPRAPRGNAHSTTQSGMGVFGLRSRPIGSVGASSPAPRRPFRDLSNFPSFSRDGKKSTADSPSSKLPSSPALTLPELPVFRALPSFELVAALAKGSIQGTPVPLAVSDFAKKMKGEREAELDAIRQRGAEKASANIKDDEKPLAGYSLARSAIRQPIDEKQTAQLRVAQETIVETRALLSQGRGNVKEDIEKTKFESRVRMQAARNLQNTLLAAFDHPDNKKYDQYRACLPDGMIKTASEAGCSPEQIRTLVWLSSIIASAVWLQAGNCDEHAYISGDLHSRKLPDTKASLQNRSSPLFPHIWTEEREADRKPRSDDPIIDGWTEGSAVLREDYRFAGLASDSNWSGHSWPLISQGAAQILAKLNSNPSVHQATSQDIAQLQQPLIGKAVVQGSGIFNSFPAVSDAFINKVQQAKKEENPERAQLLTEIETAGVARTFGLNVKSSTNKQNTSQIINEMEKIRSIDTRRNVNQINGNVNRESNKRNKLLNWLGSQFKRIWK